METIAKKYLSADGYLRDVWKLSAAVRRSGWRPDVIIALWRGGAPVGVAMHEFLKVSGWEVKHIPLKCSSYVSIGENAGGVQFTFGEPVFGMLREGDRVLVVDDVFDTGKTVEAVKEKIDAVGAEMKSACVYWKSVNNLTGLKPDFYVADTGGEWLVFPHEIDGLSPAEMAVKDPFLAELLK